MPRHTPPTELPNAPGSVLLGMMRPLDRQSPQRAIEDQPHLGIPHTVEIFPSIRGSVLLVGYDRVGEVMVEFRVPRARYSVRMAARLARWIRENDDTPPPLMVLP